MKLSPRTFLTVCFILVMQGCAAPPELLGYPVNTPKYYTEDKMFFLEQLPPADVHTAQRVKLVHVHNVNIADGPLPATATEGASPELLQVGVTTPTVPAGSLRASDVIQNGEPVTVILKGVRIPEDLPGATRDIAVVLSVNMSPEQGVQDIVAFYQREVPAGQMLNFGNLVVFADPQWDASTAPYFRVRVLDVKTERNQRSEAILRAASKLTGEVSGLVPHPIIPIVTRAVDAAHLVLSNRRNEVLLDFQVQLYGADAIAKAGDSWLGPLLAGQWLIVGRQKGKDASSWADDMWLDRETDRLMSSDYEEGINLPAPYIAIGIARTNLQVPKLVMDRSESLIKLLSSPSGKSDVDRLDNAADSLAVEIRAFTAERRLSKYQSKLDLQEIVDLLGRHVDSAADGNDLLSKHGLRRLLDVISKATGLSDLTSPKRVVDWWDEGGSNGSFVKDRAAPLGVIWKVPSQGAATQPTTQVSR